MSGLKAATDCLRATLAAAQEERDQRPGLVEGPEGLECEWAAHERTCMHEKVNALRAEHGLAPVPIEDIVSVERKAIGHSDYSQKFAFYCAEITSRR